MAEKLTKDFFDMTMHNFSTYMLNLNSKCDIPKDVAVKDKYYQTFKNLENKRFAKVMNWLYKNYTYKTFPSIAEFQKAFDQTSEGPGSNYIPPKREETPKENKFDKSKAWGIIQRDMDLMNKLERKAYRDKTGNRFDAATSRSETLRYYIPFIEEMFNNNMAYHIKNKKWEPYRAEMKKEEYFIVRCYYPPNHTFIKEQNY